MPMMTFIPYSRRMAGALALVAFASLIGRAAAEPIPFTQEPFNDIPESHVHYDAIEYLRLNNIVHGYEDGTFRADTRINRAEFVQLITNPFFLQGEKMNDCIAENNMQEDNTIFFSDVLRDVWYAEEVCIAKVKDLVDGYPDGTFKPGRNIIFVEGAKIIANTFVLNLREEGEIWYEPYVTKMGELNAIPTSVNSLNGLLTRGEVAEMLYRVKTQNTSKSSKTYANLKGRYE